MSKHTKPRTRWVARLAPLAAAGLLASVAGPALAAGSSDQSASSQQDMQESQSSQSSGDNMQASQSGQNQTLDQLAQQQGQVSDFVHALEQTGMANALTEGGQKYTIFAPTNDALQSSDIQKLMQPGHQQELVKLLRAHIVADDVNPQMAQRIGKAKTIGGGSVDLTSQNGNLQVGDAKVVGSSVQQGNVRLYAINSVLKPGEFAAFENQPSGSSQQGSMNQSDQSGMNQSDQSGMDQGDMSDSPSHSDWDKNSSEPQSKPQ